MEHACLAPTVTETGKRNMDTLKNHPDWYEWKDSEFSQLDVMDKDYIFVSPCRRPPGDIVRRQVWTYLMTNYGKEVKKHL